MENITLEYVWLDGYDTQNLRSKIKILHTDNLKLELEDVPVWNFDGSSTKQAPGDDSECLLSPVRLYSCSWQHHYVLCEVLNSDGTSHDSNSRALLRELEDNFNEAGFWWGFEQEYFIIKDKSPIGFPKRGYPDPQGRYYCSVGGSNAIGRDIAIRHLYNCLGLGMKLTGVNAEVAPSQWEYQCFAEDTLKACDDLWMSRYFLLKEAERDGLDIDFSPKPVKGDWNGSGCHTNFSTRDMRDHGGYNLFNGIIENMGENHDKHISEYGEDNNQRLTGEHETQKIDTFSWGIADRGASIRVPSSVSKSDWRGYLEDRRPASNCDPYKVAKAIVKTSLFLR
jgi:glutamine synthetase